MRQMTLRDIPEEVEAVVRNEAELCGMSLNKAFLTVLKRGTLQQQSLSPPAFKKEKGMFSRFCGVWSNDEAAVIDSSVHEQRVVDEELWQ